MSNVIERKTLGTVEVEENWELPEGWSAVCGIFCPTCWAKIVDLAATAIETFRANEKCCRENPGFAHPLIKSAVDAHRLIEQHKKIDDKVD